MWTVFNFVLCLSFSFQINKRGFILCIEFHFPYYRVLHERIFCLFPFFHIDISYDTLRSNGILYCSLFFTTLFWERGKLSFSCLICHIFKVDVFYSYFYPASFSERTAKPWWTTRQISLFISIDSHNFRFCHDNLYQNKRFLWPFSRLKLDAYTECCLSAYN